MYYKILYLNRWLEEKSKWYENTVPLTFFKNFYTIYTVPNVCVYSEEVPFHKQHDTENSKRKLSNYMSVQ
jgi:hypothetical protein